MNKYIDLHLHLDGSLSLDTVKALCHMQGRDIPHNIPQLITCPASCKDLNDYLACFDYPLSLLQSEDAVSYAVEALCNETDYRYCEIRFAPQLHTRNGLSQQQVIKAAIKGLSDRYRLILCCMRGGSNNEETVKCCYEFMGMGVVALDLAGAEALFPTRDYRHLFEFAVKEKLPFTIHAGEADGALSVKEAIEMGASRIGHGVRSVEDERVISLLREFKIPLEICPTSNINTRVFNSVSQMPIRKFVESNITVTINSDNMSVSATDVKKELAITESSFGISENVFLENAVYAAFDYKKQP